MFGMNPGGMYSGAMPSMNPSPFQYPAPSQFGQLGMMQGQPSQTQQPQQAGPDWIRVATVQQIEQVSVQPGGKAWVMVENMPVFALRVADNMGLVTTDVYRFEKIDPSAATAPQQEAFPAGDYITRDEAEKMVSDRLTAFAESLKPANKSKKETATE